MVQRIAKGEAREGWGNREGHFGPRKTPARMSKVTVNKSGVDLNSEPFLEGRDNHNWINDPESLN